MATEWVKQSRTTRMSNANSLAGPMSFNSGLFTHALATLAIDKRTEREKVALVEALLLSRTAGNSKKAKDKLKEFHQLRHKIVRDHWNKAIHQVIIHHNIPERVKAKRASQSGTQAVPPPTGSVQQKRRAGTDAQVRFNLQEASLSAGKIEPTINHVFQPQHWGSPGAHGMGIRPTWATAPSGQLSNMQHSSMYQPLRRPQLPGQTASAPMFSARTPTSQFQYQVGTQAQLRPATLHSSMTQPLAAPMGFHPNFQASTHRQLQPAHISTVQTDASVSTRPSSDRMSGPYPSAVSQLPQPAASPHGPSAAWSVASLSTCPTESSQSQASSMPAPGRARPRAHPAGAPFPAAPARTPSLAASSQNMQVHMESLAPHADVCAALPARSLQASEDHAARPPSLTPSCTTECSSEAEDASDPAAEGTVQGAQAATRHALAENFTRHSVSRTSATLSSGKGPPLAANGSGLAGRGCVGTGGDSVGGSSMATESSASALHEQSGHHQQRLHLHSARSRRSSTTVRPAWEVGCVNAAAGPAAARHRDAARVCTPAKTYMAPGPQQAWALRHEMSRRAARPTGHAAVPASSSGGSYESSSRCSVPGSCVRVGTGTGSVGRGGMDRPNRSAQQLGKPDAAGAYSGAHPRAGGAHGGVAAACCLLHETGGSAHAGGHAGLVGRESTARGMAHGGWVGPADVAAGTRTQQHHVGVTGVMDGGLEKAQGRGLLGSGAMSGAQALGHATVWEAESDGSEATEPSDDDED
eukprot:jgi/Ulvmu1/9534/UM053_0023.1